MGDQHMSNKGTSDSRVIEGNNDVSRGRLGRVDRSCRCWSDREEAIMIVALKDLVAHGWKSDNDFRAGYIKRVEETLKREFPTTDLKVNPHIHSKIIAWKKNYYSLSAILARSGVGFSAHGDFKIDCDDEQWPQIVQKDSNAKYMWNKPWPHWDNWNEIFGKVRANGGRAVDTAETINTLPSMQENVQENFSEFVGTDYPMSFEELFSDEVLPEGMHPDIEAESNTTVPDIHHVPIVPNVPNIPNKATRKRKAVDPMEKVIDLMNRMHEDTKEHLKTLLTRIGYEFDLSAKRIEVFDQLGGVPGFTLKHKFYVGHKLVKEPELIDLFKGLPEIARPAYVMVLLECEGII
ncbi:hypothetical protein AAHA92_29519 [Salvia divinorum]|uniref:Myb/SANT-like domain-containing protein n=1 Tax=Salvia divinorum TaxID=28513 RepID=A0ABD1G1K2_SALDI